MREAADQDFVILPSLSYAMIYIESYLPVQTGTLFMEYRILIVSENPADRSRYAETLLSQPPSKQVSYHIATVGSVAAAQLQATRQRFDLVIVALSQQDDGLDLSQRLKDLFPDIRLLLLCEQGVTKSQLKTARLIRASVAESTIEANSLRAIVSDILGASILAQQFENPPAQTAQKGNKTAQPGAHDAAPTTTPATLPNVVQPFLQPFLEELRRHTKAQIAIYTDKNGRIIGKDGNDREVDIGAIATVIAHSANDFESLEKLLGDPDTIHLSVHEGKQYDVYSANVKGDRFLSLFFNKSFVSPKLGFIWLMMKRSAEQLSRVN
jgi:CheY-like chemotaxis protein